jgi:hypothetical protein
MSIDLDAVDDIPPIVLVSAGWANDRNVISEFARGEGLFPNARIIGDGVVLNNE